MTHVMIDIETLSTKQNARVTQIGAVCFEDEKFGGTFEPFGVYLNPDLQPDRAVDVDTLKFWQSQPPEVYRASLDKWSEGVHPVTALQKLNNYLDDVPDLQGIWARGTTFDISILDSLGEEFFWPTWWKRKPGAYRLIRDTRTLSYIANSIGCDSDLIAGNFVEAHNIPITPHDAVDDCIFQAISVQFALDEIRRAR